MGSSTVLVGRSSRLRNAYNGLAASMKILPLFALATFAFLPIAGADLAIVQSIESDTGTHKVSLKIKGERARVEVEVAPNRSMIVDSKSGEVITLMHDQKSVLRFDREKAKKMGDRILKDTDSSLEIATPKPTGKKDKIIGYEAEEYTAETPKYKATYWVAKTYPDFQAIANQMKLLQKSIFASVRKAMPEYYDFPGLPIRTKIKFHDQPEVTITITSVSQAPLPDSDFSEPDGYSETQLPEWHAGTPPPNFNPANESKTSTPVATPTPAATP